MGIHDERAEAMRKAVLGARRGYGGGVDGRELARLHRRAAKLRSCPIARTLERLGERWTAPGLPGPLFGSLRLDKFLDHPRRARRAHGPARPYCHQKAN